MCWSDIIKGLHINTLLLDADTYGCVQIGYEQNVNFESRSVQFVITYFALYRASVIKSLFVIIDDILNESIASD